MGRADDRHPWRASSRCRAGNQRCLGRQWRDRSGGFRVCRQPWRSGRGRPLDRRRDSSAGQLARGEPLALGTRRAASALGMDSIRPAREDFQSHVVVFRHWRPVNFAGQTTLDRGRSLQMLFHRENVRLDAAHPSITIEFPPVVADNFRLLIARSSNKEIPELHAAERNPGLWRVGRPADCRSEAHAGPPTRRNARRAAARRD